MLRYQVKSLGETAHYEKYNSWSAGDTRLDWLGAQSGQGSYQGQPAEGTPLAWTSSSPSSPGYQSLNTWGDHYWMVDVDMDCSQSEQGWFEVKAFLTNGGKTLRVSYSERGNNIDLFQLDGKAM